VKYGFAESEQELVMKARMKDLGSSSADVARLLRILRNAENGLCVPVPLSRQEFLGFLFFWSVFGALVGLCKIGWFMFSRGS